MPATSNSDAEPTPSQAVVVSDACSLRFQGTVSGTSYQIATLLRQFANDIEKWNHEKTPTPWFLRVAGACSCNLNVSVNT